MTTTNNNNNSKRSTFAVLFFLNTSKPNKDGLCPVNCRVSIDGEHRAFSIKQNCVPTQWDAKLGMAKGRSRESVILNRKIDATRSEIEALHERFLMDHGYVSAQLLINAVKGIGHKETFLLKLFEEHNVEFRKRIGVDRDIESHNCYERTLREVSEFIRFKYNADDIPLSTLKKGFIEAFEFFLKTRKGRGRVNIMNHSIYLKKITKRAVAQGTLRIDPFSTHNPEQSKPNPKHHKAEELERIMQTPITDAKVCFVRDMFIFSTFTGLAHIDLYNLSEEHIITEADSSLWIKIKRQKTNIESVVKLLPPTLAIIEKYRKERIGIKIFNIKSRSFMMKCFRKVEKICNVDHITFHMARHNFATHITLSQGVPLETVSRMMGHTSTKITQRYAKILSNKLKEDMTALGKRISGKYTLLEEENFDKPQVESGSNPS